MIPLCHSLPLEHIDVAAWLTPPHVCLRAEVTTFARTGVEMEALTAVSVAALTVIDMGKAVDPGMVIEDVRLIEKTGGKGIGGRVSGVGEEDAGTPGRRDTGKVTVAILTISDRCSRGKEIDASGPALAKMVRTRLGGRVVAIACVPDERDMIAEQIRAWACLQPRAARPALILTTGGTGLSGRDVTPEATAAVLERRHPGLLELARLRCLAKTPKAFLSRGEAGTIGQTLVINLPGSPAGASECLEALLDVLPHALDTLRGSGGEHG